MVLEYVNGGELFERIASKGRFPEAEGRKLFQHLIDGVTYCHNKGVFHRDLKPKNVLIDANGMIKITDFGLSALPQHFRDDGLLHTACGSPNYVAPKFYRIEDMMVQPQIHGRGVLSYMLSSLDTFPLMTGIWHTLSEDVELKK